MGKASSSTNGLDTTFYTGKGSPFSSDGSNRYTNGYVSSLHGAAHRPRRSRPMTSSQQSGEVVFGDATLAELILQDLAGSGALLPTTEGRPETAGGVPRKGPRKHGTSRSPAAHRL